MSPCLFPSGFLFCWGYILGFLRYVFKCFRLYDHFLDWGWWLQCCFFSCSNSKLINSTFSGVQCRVTWDFHNCQKFWLRIVSNSSDIWLSIFLCVVALRRLNILSPFTFQSHEQLQLLSSCQRMFTVLSFAN